MVESPVAGLLNLQAVCVLNDIEGAGTPIAVTFVSVPEIVIGGEPKICVNNGVVTSATLTASGATSYLWSNGAATPTISVTATGAYSVTGITNGCLGVAQVMATSSVCGSSGPLVITGASINCSTREVTVQTTGGNGLPVERMIQLVTLWLPAGQPLLLDEEILKDPNNATVRLYARQQGGNLAGPFGFNFRQSCPVSSTGTETNPGVGSTTATGNVITVCNQSYTLTGAPFSLSATFTCNPGDIPHGINFLPAGGVVDPNSVIEFMSIGITPWTTACTETLDLNNTDYNVFTVNARQRNTQTGAILAMTQITVTSPCVKKTGAGREATKDKKELEVTVLGNPTLNDKVTIDVRGAENEPLKIQVIDSRGGTISEIKVEKAAPVERQFVDLGRSTGLYFLKVSTPTSVKTVKVVRQ